MGRYLGIWSEGELVAMAGDRPAVHVAADNTNAIRLFAGVPQECRKWGNP
jgi:hypothetical protein